MSVGLSVDESVDKSTGLTKKQPSACLMHWLLDIVEQA